MSSKSFAEKFRGKRQSRSQVTARPRSQYENYPSKETGRATHIAGGCIENNSLPSVYCYKSHRNLLGSKSQLLKIPETKQTNDVERLVASKSAMLGENSRNNSKSKTLDDAHIMITRRKKSAPLPKKSVQMSVKYLVFPQDSSNGSHDNFH